MKTYTLKSHPRRPFTLADAIAREHARIVRLTNQAENIRRRLASARLRYQTFNRMALDAERRSITIPTVGAAPYNDVTSHATWSPRRRGEPGDGFELGVVRTVPPKRKTPAKAKRAGKGR